MELDKIEQLLEKYFDGETSIAEENELKAYFSSEGVAQHLEQYRPFFGYLSQAKTQTYTHSLPLKTKKRNYVGWLSIAASVVVLFGIATFLFNQQPQPKETANLGTYDNPELAFEATQKALSLVSEKVNVGMGSVAYIKEYEQSKNRVFKK